MGNLVVIISAKQLASSTKNRDGTVARSELL